MLCQKNNRSILIDPGERHWFDKWSCIFMRLAMDSCFSVLNGGETSEKNTQRDQ